MPTEQVTWPYINERELVGSSIRRLNVGEFDTGFWGALERGSYQLAVKCPVTGCRTLNRLASSYCRNCGRILTVVESLKNLDWRVTETQGSLFQKVECWTSLNLPQNAGSISCSASHLNYILIGTMSGRLLAYNILKAGSEPPELGSETDDPIQAINSISGCRIAICTRRSLKILKSPDGNPMSQDSKLEQIAQLTPGEQFSLNPVLFEQSLYLNVQSPDLARAPYLLCVSMRNDGSFGSSHRIELPGDIAGWKTTPACITRDGILVFGATSVSGSVRSKVCYIHLRNNRDVHYEILGEDVLLECGRIPAYSAHLGRILFQAQNRLVSVGESGGPALWRRPISGLACSYSVHPITGHFLIGDDQGLHICDGMLHSEWDSSDHFYGQDASARPPLASGKALLFVHCPVGAGSIWVLLVGQPALHFQPHEYPYRGALDRPTSGPLTVFGHWVLFTRNADGIQKMTIWHPKFQ